MSRKGKEVMVPPQSRKRGYVTWNSQMDGILTSVLMSQINEGNKGDGDFKSQAHQAVVDKLRTELNLYVTVDHVKNRIKIWKKHHANIMDIRTYTKFIWDDERKMVVIPIEDLKEWHDYCQNKCIENWDDICTMVATDRAVGDGTEQHEESVAAMETENEGFSTSETIYGDSNKILKRDRLADAVSSFVESFKEYVGRTKGPPRPTCQEIYEVVSSILGISRHQVLKAVKRFVNGTVDEFDMLKNLLEYQKLEWVLLCIADP